MSILKGSKVIIKKNKTVADADDRAYRYCKFGNFCEDFIFAKLRICEVSRK